MIKEILNKLSRKEDLSNQEMQDVVNHIMCGEVEDNDIESFLLALNEKGIPSGKPSPSLSAEFGSVPISNSWSSPEG